MTTSILWFRRDLRLGDHPALLAARDDAGRDGEVVPLFVLDDALRRPAGAPRLAYLSASLRALADDIASMGGRLLVRAGKPEDVVPDLARSVGAERVHVSADFGPYGAARDRRVGAALGEAGRDLVGSGSPYAVSPGRVRKDDGEPYRVFTPYHRAWQRHGRRDPAPRPRVVPWSDRTGDPLPEIDDIPDGLTVPMAGERAAMSAWRAFRDERLAAYDEGRDRPDLDGSSRMSIPLKYGEIHPRTLLADCGVGAGARAFARQLAWRDFYADVLAHSPETARDYYRPEYARMDYDTGAAADTLADAWREGRTGFPIVDAGMRQLLAQGWMHNRVRLIVASFLVKDLHREWTEGARHFMARLLDGDLASNQHNWQWVAGSGLDGAPYFRVFNPVAQGQKFDPDGAYVRRWVPELRDVDGPRVHEPWTLPQPPAGYPAPVIDHAAERAEALARYERLRR